MLQNVTFSERKYPVFSYFKNHEYILSYIFKRVGVDNWAILYTFTSEVSEKPGFRNNYFFSKYVVQL